MIVPKSFAMIVMMALAVSAWPRDTIQEDESVKSPQLKNKVFKDGHDSIKEFHFHVYWMVQNIEQSKSDFLPKINHFNKLNRK